MNASSTLPIDDQTVAEFLQDGVVCLRQAFGQQWVQTLRTAVEEARRSPGPFTQVHSVPGEHGDVFIDYRTSERLASFRRFLDRGPGSAIAARLLRSERVNLYADSIFVKDPGTSRRTPWHQDQPSLNVDGRQLCNLWVALDPMPRRTSLEVVIGSHRWGRWFQSILNLQADTRSAFEPVPDIEAHRARYPVVGWDLEPGDCIAFHSLALHGAPGNPTDTPRRAVGAILLGDDTGWGDRAAYMNPPLVGHGLEVGDAMDCDFFPRL